MELIDKILVVTKKTQLDELVERFNSVGQARFYIVHMGADFDEYQRSHDRYYQALEMLRKSLPSTVRTQEIDRSFLPTYMFGDRDLVVTLGPDGLVVNTAKYLAAQPLLALNPDVLRIDGILVPFPVERAADVINATLRSQMGESRISMAKAELNDGQSLYAVNDLFIGQRTHVSARYSIHYGRHSERHSSSGIIVTTGAGSTGWFRSVITGAAEIAKSVSNDAEIEEIKNSYRFDWSADYLKFSVREPFVSKTSSAEIVYGQVSAAEQLILTSQMPQGGVIFSDGVEEDNVEFNSGSIANISVAERKLHLVTQRGAAHRMSSNHAVSAQRPKGRKS